MREIRLASDEAGLRSGGMKSSDSSTDLDRYVASPVSQATHTHRHAVQALFRWQKDF